MLVRTTPRFQKRFQALPESVQKKVIRQKGRFVEDVRHPSLNLEKLSPKQKQLWSIRVDKQYRILLQFVDDNTAVFLTVGHHHWIYRI